MFLNCNSCSTILNIFKAKIYPTNEQTTCISQIIGCRFIDMLI
ncbi:helix-turn-helix domain-containing protein [Nostoc favosum]|uniref:Helix-turn-helix domain-containing protein n=1 Tax=Nostoc favosum CHAB5714 TaxID=2780399 RepID=A0ABS8I2I1_9NOSO|nr:helix-turn-helix domain-containing protein [Nostoc favosum CHAB5714]